MEEVKKIPAIISIIIILSTLITAGYAYFRFKLIREKSTNHIDLARAALKSGDLQLAETNARLALSLNEKSAEAHFILATAFSFNRSALPEDILKHFRIAKELGLDSESFHISLAWAEMEAGDWPAAEKSIAISEAKAPEAIMTNYYKTIFLLLGKMDTEGAVAAAEKMVERYPQNPAAGRVLALALYKNGRPIEAEAAADKALSINPDYCPLNSIKAEIVKERSIIEADKLLNRAEILALGALKKNKSDFLADYCLASVYSLKGDMVLLKKEPEELARAFYEQAMKISIPRGKVSDTSRESAIKALGL